MNTILNVLFLPLAVILFFTQCEKEPEINPNDPVDIPAQAFLNALIENRMYTNGDSISDMSGIEGSVNLDTLDCSSNQPISVDVSNNIVLEVLRCFNNQSTKS